MTTPLWIYLAGPMTGYPRSNFPAFDEATAALRALGHAVSSPAEHDRHLGFDESRTPEEQGFDLRQAWRWDVEQLLQVDAIALLPGWRDSKGATLEHDIAVKLGLIVMEL